MAARAKSGTAGHNETAASDNGAHSEHAREPATSQPNASPATSAAAAPATNPAGSAGQPPAETIATIAATPSATLDVVMAHKS